MTYPSACLSVCPRPSMTTKLYARCLLNCVYGVIYTQFSGTREYFEICQVTTYFT